MSHKSLLTRRCLFSLPLAATAAAQPATPPFPAVAVAAALKELTFDAAQCWRVRDLALVREDVKLYLTDGFVMFSRPLAGAPVAALFWAEVEGGDGEVIVLPPTAGERQSLARFTESPNLNEHFRSAVMIFTDGTAAEIAAHVKDTAAKAAPEMGALLADQYSPTLRNLTTSFETRIIQDVAGKAAPRSGLFFAALAGAAHGNFDVIYDPQAMDQVVLAQLQSRENRSYYNIWTSFPSRRVRKDPAAGPPLREFAIEHVQIAAALGVELRLTATVTLRIRVPEQDGLRRDRNTLAFDISRRMRVRSVKVDGAEAQVVQRESLRSTLLRGSENEVFLVAMAEAIAPGEHTVVFEQDGEVILPAGNGVYFVSARGTWYPHHGLQFATYDLTFKCPRPLELVATGELVEERDEGEIHVTRRRSMVPLRIAGFNLGEYKRSKATRGGLTVEVYANKMAETGLAASRRDTLMPPAAPPGRPNRLPSMQPPMVITPVPIDPAGQITELATEVAEAFEFLASRFGAPPLKTLAVSPIPGGFGQGFPGLIYLSTLAYLPPRDRPQFANQGMQQVFFSDILVAHEVAHQWWGNTVTTAGYRDEWMMEALANYSALLLLERKRGARAVEEILERYRDHLLDKGVNGKPIDAAGPILMGARLETSETPEAYRAILYEKGTWIIHMLRRRLGDSAFFALLKDLHTQFLRSNVTTVDLKLLAAKHLPQGGPEGTLEQLFGAYAESTGIPVLKLQTKQRRTGNGTVVTVELEQSGVGEDFSIDVPVELDFGRGKTEVRWIRTDGERTSAEWTLPAAPVRVLLDPRNSLLAVKR
jgi:hypothetical protein